MTDNAISPLRQRMIEDMTARHFAEKAQKDFNPDAVEAALGRHASAIVRSIPSPSDNNLSSFPADARNCTPVGRPAPSDPDGRDSPHMQNRLPREE